MIASVYIWLENALKASEPWFTTIGLVIAGLGLFLTYRQAREAKIQATDAAKAALSAQKRLLSLDVALELNRTKGLLEKMHENITNGDHKVAYQIAADARLDLEQILRSGADLDQTIRNDIELLATNLYATIESLLFPPKDAVDIAELQKQVLEMQICLTGVCARLRIAQAGNL